MGVKHTDKLKIAKSTVKIAAAPVEAAQKTISVGQSGINMARTADKSASETAAPSRSSPEEYVGGTAEKGIIEGYRVTEKSVKQIVRTPRKAVNTTRKVKTAVKNARNAAGYAKNSLKSSQYAVSAARNNVKTARQTLKTTHQTAKAARRTAKTAYNTAKTAGRTARTAAKASKPVIQAAAKATAQTVKAAVKVTVETVKAVAAAIKEAAVALVAAIGPWGAAILLAVLLVFGVVVGVASCSGNGNSKYSADALDSVLGTYMNKYVAAVNTAKNHKPGDAEMSDARVFEPDWKTFLALGLSYITSDREIENGADIDLNDKMSDGDIEKFETVYGAYIVSVDGKTETVTETVTEQVETDGRVTDVTKEIEKTYYTVETVHNTPEQVMELLRFTARQREYYGVLINGNNNFDATDFWAGVSGLDTNLHLNDTA